MKEITMPKLSDTMTEGTVVAWRKAMGARVARGEVIAEVETDKATMELESFASGVLLEMRIAPGTTVPVGTVIGVIGEEGEAPPAREAAPPAAAPKVEAEAPVVPEAAPAAEAGSAAAPPAVSAVAGEVLAAPVVRRRARELGIDLATMTGSGPGGRILLEDLEPAAAGEQVEAREAGAEPAREPPAAMPAPAVPQAAPGAPAAAGEPLSRMRAAIARTVSESWRTIPHFSVTVEIRMDAAERFREEQRQQGTALSLTALLVKATARALASFPRLNASLRDERLILHPTVNIGIVARQGDGLLVPVLHDCAALPLAAVAERAAQLVERARHGRLSDTELSGGTFAISNLGMYGVDSFVALILPPMAAVLAVGAERHGVVAEAGRPVVARLLSLTLSADHRIVDGVYAAEFLQAVRQLLEDPAKLAAE